MLVPVLIVHLSLTYFSLSLSYAMTTFKLINKLLFCDPEHKLFVGMLPKNVSDAELSALFSQYGNITDLQILRGSQQTSKGTSCVRAPFLL